MYVPRDYITAVVNNVKRKAIKALNEELACMAARSNIKEGL